MTHYRHRQRRGQASYKGYIVRRCSALLCLFIMCPAIAQATCQTVGIESAGLNSHQRNYDTINNGYFLVEVHFESCDKCANEYDSPVIKEVIACNTDMYQHEPMMKWDKTPYWVEIGAAGINSHQRNANWKIPDGYFITQIDLDGWMKGGGPSAMDGPVIGAVRIAKIPGYKWDDCRWVDFGWTAYNRTYGIWSWRSPPPAGPQVDSVPDGYYITQLDLDSAGTTGRDSPIIGAVRVCRLTKG